MNRNVVSGIVAFALLVGAATAMNESSAYAGNCGGGLFAKLHAKKACGGGLFAKLKARQASSCCAPEPVCCEPAPAPACCEPAPTCGGRSRPKLFARLCAKIRAKRSCCAPEPTCCEPAPAPCCAPEPAPCGGCGNAAPAPCSSCGGSVMSAPMMSATVGSDAGFELADGETLVPGSVQNTEPAGEPAAASASDAAPPVPQPDADTNI
jgi:hypothetical protein